MRGLMQHHPLLVSSVLEHAAREHRGAEIVSLSPGVAPHRCGYADIERRAKQLANALERLGIREGDRVASMAWNSYRHMELFYGVSGMGAVLHTVNPRLFPEQITYMIGHAGDQQLFFDAALAPLVEQLAPTLPTVKSYIVLGDRSQLPANSIPNLVCYEELIGAESGEYDWPRLDELAATSLCYTSGTTGNPKGVLYTNRSTVLHAMTICLADGVALSARDTLYMASPMFHVNAWGTPYACPMAGASVVLPGPALDGASIYHALRDEAVTVALGVPTVWMGFQQHLASQNLDPKRDLQLERVLIGGAAAPRSVVETFEVKYGVRVIHGWGMTETSPLATVGAPLKKHRHLSAEERVTLEGKQGRVMYGVEIKLVGDQGETLPNDGKAFGHLLVRGHWIVASYFGGEGGKILDKDDWFDTGDIATIDPDGYMHITDRAKDLIKSGGEWISSIALENAAVGHPAVLEAAVIAIPHEKWQERPLLVVVRRPGVTLTREELLAYLSDKVAKWWLPDDVQFLEQLPHTATGKLQKMKLREMFGGYRFPDP